DYYCQTWDTGIWVF
nr:immunoglobulin light chain junction region [Macaca mulatta]MOX30074.1 immunoglobulin light chain junction region [Macaca mulatta]MOX32091.1 immunoglobulin light chain junction region [Macaca mulatta]MOX32205.1 immunoglobulin light chain junction region [Macaca mulatta]MOX32247.1 immunoglobulin light chain junction region [Macaca mulatta]